MAVFGGVEGPVLDREDSFGADAHGGEQGRMEVGDGDRIFDRDAGPLVGSSAVDKSPFDATAEKHHR